MSEMNWPDPAAAGAKPSVLAEDLQITGDVVSTGPVEVFGKLDGSLRASEVTVAASAKLTGRVSAARLAVSGVVEGKVEAKALALASGGVVLADVTYAQIAIESGGRVEGTLKHSL